MNSPPEPEDRDDLRHAEYVLGVLDANARAEIEREVESDPLAATEVARWQKHLLPLAEDVAPVPPAEYVWARVRGALGFTALEPRTAPAPNRSSPWQNATLWRWMALGAGAVAAACIALLIVLPRAPSAPPTGPIAYITARIQQDNGLPGWTATLDTSHARLVLVPVAPNVIPPDRVPELWLIPAGGKPIPVGVLATDEATTLTLDRSLLTHANARALLAVSIEPPGGSPTGQPTGPVIGKGALS